MTLESLPAELFDGIVRYTFPCAFESIALTCKGTHRRCQPYFYKYNKIRRRFRNFAFDADPENSNDEDRTSVGDGDSDEPYNANDDETKPAAQVGSKGRIANAENTYIKDLELTRPIHHVMGLLHAIAEMPSLAAYMETVDLSGDSKGHGESDHQPPYLEGDATAVLELLHRSPYFAAKGCDPDEWFLKIQTTLQGHADVFLLTLLPNVKELTVCDRYLEGDHGEESLLDYIVECANAPTASQNALARLEHVEVSSEEANYETKHSMTPILPLLAINTVRSFTGCSMVALEDNYTGVCMTLRHDQLSSSLRNIRLDASLLGAQSAQELVKRAKHLQTFFLGWDIKWHGCGSSWDIGAMIYVLQEHVGESLEILTLRDDSGVNDLGSTLTDMTGFAKLRDLELDFPMLCQPEFNFGNGISDDIMDKDGDIAVPRLVDLLPASIQYFQLNGVLCINEGDDDHLRKLLSFTSEERRQKLPKWEKFVIKLEGWEDAAIRAKTRAVIGNFESRAFSGPEVDTLELQQRDQFKVTRIVSMMWLPRRYRVAWQSLQQWLLERRVTEGGRPNDALAMVGHELERWDLPYRAQPPPARGKGAIDQAAVDLEEPQIQIYCHAQSDVTDSLLYLGATLAHCCFGENQSDEDFSATASTVAGVHARKVNMTPLTTAFVAPTSCDNTFLATTVTGTSHANAGLVTEYELQYSSEKGCQPTGATDPIERGKSYSLAVCPSGWTAHSLGASTTYGMKDKDVQFTATCCSSGFSVTHDYSAAYSPNSYVCAQSINITSTVRTSGGHTTYTSAFRIHAAWPISWKASDVPTLTPTPPPLQSTCTNVAFETWVPTSSPLPTRQVGFFCREAYQHLNNHDVNTSGWRGTFYFLVIGLPLILIAILLCIGWHFIRRRRRRQRGGKHLGGYDADYAVGTRPGNMDARTNSTEISALPAAARGTELGSAVRLA
ncbi:hypothetical protein PWT90_11052 [Aphanocladium album]|nr:hypothetical protein PWT90_11052 [Aphanocladium album]